MFRSSLDTSIKPILCPRKSGPTHNHQVLYHPGMAELYRKKVSELQTLLMSAETRTRAMELIRSLIERIEVFPGQKRGNPEVTLIGALAQILTFGQTKTTTATSLEDDGRVLMVAGARNQRCLHLDEVWL